MHLEGIPLTQVDAEIGLMIGGNCPEALCPLEVRRGGEGEPFAFRSELGWAVYGPRELRSTRDHGAARVNRVSVLRGDSDIHEKFVSLYNKDFEDNGSSTDVGLSVEDRVWLKTVEAGTRYIDGHYEIPLPLKEDAPFPDNKQQALLRAEHLKRKMNKNDKYMERNLAVNDVVLVMDTSTPRSRWPLGRIKETFPDRKGFVRSAMVQTETSVLKRPISKLVLILEAE